MNLDISGMRHDRVEGSIPSRVELEKLSWAPRSTQYKVGTRKKMIWQSEDGQGNTSYIHGNRASGLLGASWQMTQMFITIVGKIFTNEFADHWT